MCVAFTHRSWFSEDVTSLIRADLQKFFCTLYHSMSTLMFCSCVILLSVLFLQRVFKICLNKMYTISTHTTRVQYHFLRKNIRFTHINTHVLSLIVFMNNPIFPFHRWDGQLHASIHDKSEDSNLNISNPVR